MEGAKELVYWTCMRGGHSEPRGADTSRRHLCCAVWPGFMAHSSLPWIQTGWVYIFNYIYILYPSLSPWYLVVTGWLWEILEEADEAGCLRTLSLEFGIGSSSIPSRTRLPSLVSECCRSCALQYSESWRPTVPKCWSSLQADTVMLHHVAVCEMQKYTYI